MKAPINTELALRERIKELTCLYEVSSIIVNADVGFLNDTLKAIAFSLKKAFRFPNETRITIVTGAMEIGTSIQKNTTTKLISVISVFNKKDEDDPNEQKNLAGNFPERVSDLKEKLLNLKKDGFSNKHKVELN